MPFVAPHVKIIPFYLAMVALLISRLQRPTPLVRHEAPLMLLVTFVACVGGAVLLGAKSQRIRQALSFHVVRHRELLFAAEGT